VSQRRVLIHFLEVACNGPELAAFFEALGQTDASALARGVRVPTLRVTGDVDTTIPVGGSSVASGLLRDRVPRRSEKRPDTSSGRTR
jgi:hypothetical protein